MISHQEEAKKQMQDIRKGRERERESIGSGRVTLLVVSGQNP